MTKARRRVVRLALMLQVAGIEPIFVGGNYRKMQAGLELQWSGLTPDRRKAVRRRADRLIAKAQGLRNAADHLVPQLLRQKSSERQLCPVCRMRIGLPKRIWSRRESAEHVRDQQSDPLLVVDCCPAGYGWHLGHRSGAKSAAANYLATTFKQRESHGADVTHDNAQRIPYGNESHTCQSVIDCNLQCGAVADRLRRGHTLGAHARNRASTPIAGGVLMAVHDMATGILWFWLAARCARSEMQRNNHR